ncbi:hypothetical protein ACTXT7_015665, partial [Hymenolepis weldensis]
MKSVYKALFRTLCGYRLKCLQIGYFLFQGIVGRVLLDGQELLNWDMKGLDFRTVNPPYLVETEVSYPDSGAIYKGVFTVPSPPADTFAVLQGFKRRIILINSKQNKEQELGVLISKYRHNSQSHLCIVVREEIFAGQFLNHVFIVRHGLCHTSSIR